MLKDPRALLATSEKIVDEKTIQKVIDRMAVEITTQLSELNPLVLSVMNGAVFFAGQLLPRLAFPLECDYLHATRYRNTTQGHGVEWIAEPRTPVAGRVVLVLDDILDEGITLAAIHARLMEQGAATCLVAVLAVKNIGQPQPILPDFAGITLPNRYVFGCGMDVRGAWRNLPAIYAIRE
ncbi:MAG: hypoxanthine-guanine phosphoribosyltransferase [Rhodocyclaceae bacterium]|nr:hypoxanthine-guanine phosphoribosyltransferase [Rhodocyclaceae bacterium]